MNTEDTKRFTAETIDGVYIPKDIEDCFKQIDNLWDDQTKEKIRKMTEEEFSLGAHFDFGMWIRNNWQLWGGSRLSEYFEQLGINHPDDMSVIILNCYYRHLKAKDIRFEEEIKNTGFQFPKNGIY